MDNDTKELLKAAKKSHEVIYKTTTVFPFTPFPDTITIDREKVTIANRYFFRVAKLTSSPIDHIQNVEANIGPFFGSVQITSRFFYKNIRQLRYLWREDAEKIQKILQGFIIVSQKDFSVTDVPKDQLLKMLIELGSGEVD
jgi:hypothetical protein